MKKIHAVEGGTSVKQSEIKAYAEMLKILGDIYSAQHNDALAKSFYRKA
ncbi:MAG: hypothetical protein IJL14_07520 [Selenomonadaceae bacterium]|nr:hypothetical protein [Selenomonadaceae bacterium]